MHIGVDLFRYVRRPAEDNAVKDKDSSIVRSRQEGGFEEVDFVVDSIVDLANALETSGLP